VHAIDVRARQEVRAPGPSDAQQVNPDDDIRTVSAEQRESYLEEQVKAGLRAKIVLHDGEFDLHVVTGRPGVRTDLMCLFDELFRLCLVDAREMDVKLDC